MNKLTGEIPANLSSCINLVYLDLDYNKLSGKLPVGLSALLELEQLHVYSNELEGPLFDIIQNITSLEVISASLNSFTGTIPNNIGKMQNLFKLVVASNKLSGTLPVSLFNISSLQDVDLGDNQFIGKVPTRMGFSVSRLTWFGLSSNNLSGALPSITNFTNLEVIEFHNNSFSGRVPFDFGQFYNLKVLHLAANYLEGDIGFVSTLINSTKLSTLALYENQFSGAVPKSVANLSTSILHILIGDNSMIGGDFPIGITNLFNLRVLSMYSMKLTSSIPDDIGKLHKLESLEVDSNRLIGKIPDTWSNLSRLSKLFLSDNKLEGSIPQSLAKCESMLFLHLSYNELNGTLPSELFGTSVKFVGLELTNNNFEGPLPVEISQQTSLVELYLSENKFTGVLPNGLSKCNGLRNLYMDGNFFHGDIPSSYASLTTLQQVNFSRNNLSGPVPDLFSRISSIDYLDLSYNDFHGKVPTNSVFANASEIFLAGNNKLCGGIPQLNLTKCIDQEITVRKKRAVPHSLRLIIPVISALLLVALVTVIGMYCPCFRKKKTPLESASATGETFMKVSYDMLLKATSGFSSDTLLGSGSFGSVFKGILYGKEVAVKVLNLQHHAASKSFVAECKALRNVRHRNLVGIITACLSTDFQRNDFRALVYEFMPNSSLDKWIHGVFGNLSLEQRVGVAIDVAHALNYLHHEYETPIVHCDLKPSNILLDEHMVAHVGDFGLARFLTQPRHPNQSSTLGIMGTIGYAAPEYGLGSGASTAGDVYSYGILLLELITGKSPTDSMFKEDYNLHMYAKAPLPDHVFQIVDPILEEDNLTEEVDNTRAIQDALQRRVECIISVLNVGVLCSNHLPQERMKISEVISRLQAARDNLSNARNRRN